MPDAAIVLYLNEHDKGQVHRVPTTLDAAGKEKRKRVEANSTGPFGTYTIGRGGPVSLVFADLAIRVPCERAPPANRPERK